MRGKTGWPPESRWGVKAWRVGSTWSNRNSSDLMAVRSVSIVEIVETWFLSTCFTGREREREMRWIETGWWYFLEFFILSQWALSKNIRNSEKGFCLYRVSLNTHCFVRPFSLLGPKPSTKTWLRILLKSSGQASFRSSFEHELRHAVQKS